MRKYLFLLTCSIAAPATAQTLAQTSALAEPASPIVTVVATGIETRIDETAQPITIITREEIDDVQGADITRVLRRAPGVTATRNGGIGGFTGVRVRGAGAEQLLVLVDGVRVNDVASPAGGFDFGNLPAGAVEKIELLRGPNSVIWGSDAIGGVMNIVTRAAPGLFASAEYGAHDQFAATAGAGIERGALAGGVTALYTRTDGFSSAETGVEPDGFRQLQFTGRARLAVSETLSLTADARYADGELDIDGFPPPNFAFADTAEQQDTREIAGRAGLRYAGEWLDIDAGFAISDIERELFDPLLGDNPYFRADGTSERAELFGRAALPGDLRLDFGADHQWTRFATGPFGSAGSAEISGAHALAGWYGETVAISAGARIDDHSGFGSRWSFGANGAVEFAPGWRLTAAYGEGFKAPSLFQLLSDFGNRTLRPETSRGYDVSIGYATREAPFYAALSAFRRDTRNLIDFVSCFGVSGSICAGRPFGTYDNIGRARAQGFELELGARPVETLQARVVYSHVEARDRTAGSPGRGNDLARRPRHAATVSLDWDSPWLLALGGDVRLVGDSFDDAANNVPLDGYVLADIRAALPLGAGMELYGRIENLFDVEYRPVAGYNVAGRSAYVGARWRL